MRRKCCREGLPPEPCAERLPRLEPAYEWYVALNTKSKPGHKFYVNTEAMLADKSVVVVTDAP